MWQQAVIFLCSFLIKTITQNNDVDVGYKGVFPKFVRVRDQNITEKKEVKAGDEGSWQQVMSNIYSRYALARISGRKRHGMSIPVVLWKLKRIGKRRKRAAGISNTTATRTRKTATTTTTTTKKPPLPSGTPGLGNLTILPRPESMLVQGLMITLENDDFSTAAKGRKSSKRVESTTRSNITESDRILSLNRTDVGNETAIQKKPEKLGAPPMRTVLISMAVATIIIVIISCTIAIYTTERRLFMERQIVMEIKLAPTAR